MADKEILNAILHYKKNIEKISTTPERALKNEDRLLHCISKLLRIPVTVKHLHETGVGRTVNALRKIEGNKGLAHAAKALVAKWKYMVIKEDAEEAVEEKKSNFDQIKFIREAEKNFRNIDEQLNKSNEKTERSPDKVKHVSSKDNRQTHSEKSEKESAKSHKNNLEKNGCEKSESHSSKSSSSHKSNENRDKHKSHSSSSVSSSKHHKSSANDHKSKSSKDDKTHHKSDKHSSKHEDSKTSLKRKIVENESVDCSSGASFAAALGPIIVKKSKKIKSSHVSPSTSMSKPSSSSTKNYLHKPERLSDQSDLLDSPNRLEPLDLDIMDSLPTTPEPSDALLPVPVPNYKPRPSYNIDMSPKRKVLSEDDALISIMSNKNQRTKVYSGVKGGWSYVPTLFEITCRVLQQNFDGIEHTGGIPYSIMKPILDGVSAAQLYQFEHYNPYILEDTDHLWKFHVNKEFRSEKRQEMETWREMYLRCLDEREEKYKAVTANIQKTIKQSLPVRTTKLAYVDNPKPPRNILRKQIKNGTSRPDHSKLLGRNNAEVVRVPAPKQLVEKETPAIFKIKPRVAPLMQKTLKSIKMTHFKR